MADEIDRAQENQLLEQQAHLAMAREAAAAIPVGAPGECDGCFEHSPRLVRGFCARCRDMGAMS